MKKWLQPSGTPFLVLTVFFFVMAVVCFVQGENIGGVMLVIFGLLGLNARRIEKKKK